MNPKYYLERNAQTIRAHYTDKQDRSVLINQMISWLPRGSFDYIIACIGTDRSTGDALGPLVGSYLLEKKLSHLTVYGTLKEPIHALNLNYCMGQIKQNHQKPFIIAIDACLGRKGSIGHLIAKKEPLQPGTALNKDLPAVGDIHLAGVVNVSGFMEYSVLQNTRLFLVNEMALNIARMLQILDRNIRHHTFIQTVM